MVSVDSLQRRRAGLEKRLQAQRARVEHYLELLVSARNSATDVEAQLALVDKKINESMDRTLDNIRVYHDEVYPPS